MPNRWLVMYSVLRSDVLVTAVCRVKPLIYLTICRTANSTLNFMVCSEHEEKKTCLVKETLQTLDLETERKCYRADCVIVVFFYFYWINICLSITFPLSLDQLNINHCWSVDKTVEVMSDLEVKSVCGTCFPSPVF